MRTCDLRSPHGAYPPARGRERFQTPRRRGTVLPAECQVEARGRQCGVTAIGRCGRCGRAYCQSHYVSPEVSVWAQPRRWQQDHRTNLCSTCVDEQEAAKLAEEWERFVAFLEASTEVKACLRALTAAGNPGMTARKLPDGQIKRFLRHPVTRYREDWAWPVGTLGGWYFPETGRNPASTAEFPSVITPGGHIESIVGALHWGHMDKPPSEALKDRFSSSDEPLGFPTRTSRQVVAHLKSIMRRHGVEASPRPDGRREVWDFGLGLGSAFMAGVMKLSGPERASLILPKRFPAV